MNKHDLESPEGSTGVIVQTVGTRILRHIKQLGLTGCTDEEGQDALGIPGNSWRPARLKLWRDGLVEPNGQRRLTITGHYARVYVATPNLETL